MKEIKFKFIYGILGKIDTYFSKTFSFDDIGLGKHLKVLEGNGYNIVYKSQYLGHSDSHGTELYQGDILKVMYDDSNSKIFEVMKENGDDEIYLIFDVESPYLSTCYRTHDEEKYFTGASINGDSTHFLRYLLTKDNSTIVGNVIQNPDILDKIIVEESS